MSYKNIEELLTNLSFPPGDKPRSVSKPDKSGFKTSTTTHIFMIPVSSKVSTWKFLESSVRWVQSINFNIHLKSTEKFEILKSNSKVKMLKLPTSFCKVRGFGFKFWITEKRNILLKVEWETSLKVLMHVCMYICIYIKNNWNVEISFKIIFISWNMIFAWYVTNKKRLKM